MKASEAATHLADKRASPGGYLGLDPGASGGIAYLWGDGGCAWNMPDTDTDLWAFMSFIASRYSPFAMLEEVHAMPRDASRAAFSFGIQFGRLRMCLSASLVPYDKVTPQKWQRALKCLSKGNKNVTKQRAQELFPDLKVTHKIADALLIAEYCRRLRTGTL